jgi:hypothetical protein
MVRWIVNVWAAIYLNALEMGIESRVIALVMDIETMWGRLRRRCGGR